MFKVGETVVHISHGIGVIRGIETREKLGTFYILNIDDNGASKKVFVPIDAAARMRKIVSASDVEAIFSYLRNESIPASSSATWNRRYRDYMEKLHTGDLMHIAEVLKSLFQLKAEKDLSFGERKLLDQAKTMLVKECAAATGKYEGYFENELENIATVVAGKV